MNNNQFTEVVLGLLDECKELLAKKGEDYSTDGDEISHFKDAEQFTSLSRWQVWEALFFKHLQGIRTYMKGGRKSLNEDIHHRIRDAMNYLILLEAMLVEEGHEKVPKKEADPAENPKLVEEQEVFYAKNDAEYEAWRIKKDWGVYKAIVNVARTEAICKRGYIYFSQSRVEEGYRNVTTVIG